MLTILNEIGSNALQPVECRVIVTTNRNLPALVADGRFREDLSHRVNIFPLTLPPLRERKDDIPQLCDHVLGQLRQHLGKPLHGISRKAVELMMKFHWRGKVIPIVDFRKRFNREADFDGNSRDRRIVVGAIGGTTVGLVVDQVSHVIKLGGGEVTPAPQVKGFDSAFIKGVGKLRGGLLIILDTERLFTQCQLEAIERAA